MKKDEIGTFIEQMEEIGDNWTAEEVEDVYGEKSLEEALIDRKSNIGSLMNIIGKVINR